MDCPECGKLMKKIERKLGQLGEKWECKPCKIELHIHRDDVTGG